MSAPAAAGRKLPFHSWDVEKCLRHFATDREDGLTKADAAGRLEKHGPNELLGQSGVSKWKVFAAQLANSMTIVLLLAFIISMAVRDWVEAGVVMIVIITNTFIGYLQEYRAEKTMASLRSLTSPTALVVREGAQHHIPALQVVSGDIIQFKDGDVIPADLRLLEVFNLEIDEALLTGESAPVAKRYVSDHSTPVLLRAVDRAFAGAE
ncbi:MAG: hypothetical protein BJ554DRAFT_7348 [Olpidium bornovanus]|uniref:Cation-transporting P-type ATPase N-terminal domain-containing protein n=1 Tax=Olpidium bornovanus TaxID=278681 RepID=A0A8H7ZWL2_9FUNG|nr:MAG: hypothetical protein BJ554DRAFT_7348 [Olpidium bornovanus]